MHCLDRLVDLSQLFTSPSTRRHITRRYRQVLCIPAVLTPSPFWTSILEPAVLAVCC
jgi:hypothetical protein